MATFLPPSGCHEMLHGTVTQAIDATLYWDVYLVTLRFGVHGSLNTVSVLALGGLPLWSKNSPSK